jgi:hypothetical protein
LRRIALAALTCLGFAAPSFADPAMTGAPVVMRTAPSGKARVVQRIPANAEIDLSSCSHGWCYSSWRNLFGYIPADVVVAGGAPGWPASGPAPLPPPAVVAAPVVVAPAFTWGGPYVGVGAGYGWGRW